MQKKQPTNTPVALITGAARRIGAEIARILHENGLNVIIHYHTSKKEASALSLELNKKRPQSAIVLKANLGKLSELKKLIQQSVKSWGKLDVLVNNASCFYKTSVNDVNESSWNHILDTNLKAPFFLAQLAAPYLKTQLGSIINIVDIHAEKPLLDYPIYTISKAGLGMLTKTLARELGPEIRVNSVSPGAIIWPEGHNKLSPQLKQKIISHTALKRHGGPKEIAKAVLFLVRDADYITGQDIAVDGGRSLFL